MNWNWISNVHWTNGIKHWLCFIQKMEFKTNVCWKVYVHKTCCLLVSLKTLKVLPFVELEKGSFAKWKLINNGHFVGRFCLIAVYLTSLLCYFNGSLFLVWWFCGQWARVAFCSCVHTFRFPFVNVPCIFSMYSTLERWILKPNVKGVAFCWVGERLICQMKVD